MSTASPAASVPLPVGRLVGVGAIIFAANAALLVLQLVAGRLLAPFIGSSLETWTSIIGVFLTGIALGNGFGGRIADRYPTPRALAALLVCGAIAALWMFAFPQLLSATGLYTALPLGPRIPVLAFLLCLPAGLVLSLLTPLAIKLGLPDVAHTGRVAGLIFALSTLGCLLGNYVTGFVLIPLFTVNALVFVSAGVLVLLAFAAAAMPKTNEVATDAPAEETPATDAPVTNPHAFSDIRVAYLIVFLASFCGMALELTASRVLAQHLGVSLFTWTGIIGVMLAGTALGNFTGGQLADRVNRPGSRANPRTALAATLCLAAAATVFMFVALALVSRYEPFGEWGPITEVLGWTFALFFLPMFVLGFVSPQVIRLAVPDVARVGQVAGRVYAWSTAGAIVGTFAAGYVLMSALGTYNTVLVLALVLVCTSLLVAKVWEQDLLLYAFAIVLGGIVGGFILSASQRGRDYFALVESDYYTIRVGRMSGEGRENLLTLNLDRLLHSVVDPTDPEYLYYKHEHIQVEFLYRARALAGPGAPPPKSLVIGGGGYTYPRYVVELMNGPEVDVVEIDPAVTRVAYEHLGLAPNPRLRPYHMDGRQFVAERAAPGSYDLVVQDAVNDLSVPAHLMTKEYNDAVKRALKPDGAYLLTIIDAVSYGKLWRSAMATLKQTFPAENVVLIASVPIPEAGTKAGTEWDDNRQVMVIYASDKPVDMAALRAAQPLIRVPRESEELSGFLGLVAGVGVALPPREREPHIFTHPVPAERLKPFLDADPGVVLTDQFCPIDNMMAEVFRQRKK